MQNNLRNLLWNTIVDTGQINDPMVQKFVRSAEELLKSLVEQVESLEENLRNHSHPDGSSGQLPFFHGSSSKKESDCDPG